MRVRIGKEARRQFETLHKKVATSILQGQDVAWYWRRHQVAKDGAIIAGTITALDGTSGPQRFRSKGPVVSTLVARHTQEREAVAARVLSDPDFNPPWQLVKKLFIAIDVMPPGVASGYPHRFYYPLNGLVAQVVMARGAQLKEIG